MSQQVQQFFVGYEKANASSDTSAMSDFYAETFMFGGTNGAQVVSRVDFLKVIPKMKAHFSSLGLTETRLLTVELGPPISSRFLLAKVDWRMIIRSSSGGKHVDASATYVLTRGHDDALSIVFQIDHQDLAALMRDQHV
jgi:hypothetical protein